MLGRILVVDDDQSVVDTFTRMLKLEGFEVTTTLDPAGALELAERMQPQAILVDLRMPLVNGIQVLRQIRSHPRLANVPVAIVTGDYFLPDELYDEVMTLGATLKFKPMWLDELLALAKTLIPPR